MPRFIRRERKHKRLARQASASHDAPTNSNVEELPSTSTSEREARRAALKQQLRDQQPQSSISSKKRKRLEKYVDTKLKKEENARLLRKLGEQQVDTSLFQSSKKLGRTQETKREKFQRALKERDALGIEHEDVLFEPRREAAISEVDEDPSEADDSGSEHGKLKTERLVATTFGSGLKRPLDVDERGQPLLRKRKRRKRAVSPAVESNGISDDADEDFDEDDEWKGFSNGEEDLVDSDHDASSGFSSDEASDAEFSITSDDEVADDNEMPVRVSAFKAWADSQRNAAIGFTPSTSHDTSVQVKAAFTPRAPSPDPLLDSISAVSQSTPNRVAASITIMRSEDVQKARLELPVVQEEQKIIETIKSNPVTIICGATGSGKTTQVPQMLFENGYGSLIGASSTSKSLEGHGMIGVTQPRRVAATSVADRVSHELGSAYGDRVAHQVRYDTNVSKRTAIKFMTDGILLREIQTDFALSKYSCIIIDEAHERSVNTDILIGLLSRIVRLRTELALEQAEKFYPLKLIIMSATLRVNDFLQNDRLFGDVKPPVVEIEGRQYAVTEHFARRTKRDYVSEMVEKVARGHRKLPGGGMLVFLTGQQEISTVARRLKERLVGASRTERSSDPMFSANATDDFEDDLLDIKGEDEFLAGEDEDAFEDGDDEIAIQVDRDAEDEFAIENTLPDAVRSDGPLKPHILPLYAALPASQQQRVFQPAPDGSRLIVLATNVAETSLTIPGIRYVFDGGRSKEKRYDQMTGIQTFQVDWISKASAAQRSGRAGRTGPGGHVWRLYSSAVYEQYFDEHTMPEILRTPLESVILQLKALEVENVAGFPFPTAPDAVQLVKAEDLLQNLGAVNGEKISDIGREIMKFPVNPRFGKILVLARKNNVIQHAIALVSGLAVGDLYIPEAQSNHDLDEDSDDENDANALQKQHQAHTRAQAALSRWDDQSDAIKLLTAIAAHAHAQSKSEQGTKEFCKNFWLREKNMNEVQQLRRQLHAIFKTQGNENLSDFKLPLKPPSEKECKILNQIVAASFIDQVATRADMLKDEGVPAGKKPRRAIEVPYRTLLSSVSASEIDRTANAAEREIQRSVFVHPWSVLAKLSPKEMPQYLVYSHLSQGQPSTADGQRKKTRMHPLTAIGPKAIAALAEGSPLLDIGKPVGKIEELGNRKRQCWVSVSIRSPNASGLGWPLGAWKVLQSRNAKGEWKIEEVLAR